MDELQKQPQPATLLLAGITGIIKYENRLRDFLAFTSSSHHKPEAPDVCPGASGTTSPYLLHTNDIPFI